MKLGSEYFLSDKFSHQSSVLLLKFVSVMALGGAWGYYLETMNNPEASVLGASIGGAVGGIIFLINRLASISKQIKNFT